MRFVLWWYAVDTTGRFLYRKAVLQRLKGWGKDPLIAVMSLVEFVGPSRFSHWHPLLGEPVAKSHPQAWVQVAAVSRDQTRNTMLLMPSLMSDLLIDTYGIKPGIELLRADHGRKRLEAVTSSFRAIEGGRATFTVLNESHHWVRGNNGDRMYETIDGNATKKSNRYIAITNAFLPGEDSVGERMRQSWEDIQEGRAADVGFLYDSIEAHPATPLTPDALAITIPRIRGDAIWLDVQAIIQSVLDTTIAPSRSRRMWLNQIVAEEDALFALEQWIPLETPGATLAPGDPIVMGFDGGLRDDATGAVAIRISDGCIFVLGLWERPDGPAGDGWEVDRNAVDSAIHDAFKLYDVKGFFADVALWESHVSEWAESYGERLAVHSDGRNAIAWDMRQSLKRVTLANERLVRAILDGRLHHDGDRRMRRHVLNVGRRTNVHGVSFGKLSNPRKIDLYAALLLAHEALREYRTRGSRETGRTGVGFFL